MVSEEYIISGRSTKFLRYTHELRGMYIISWRSTRCLRYLHELKGKVYLMRKNIHNCIMNFMILKGKFMLTQLNDTVVLFKAKLSPFWGYDPVTIISDSIKLLSCVDFFSGCDFLYELTGILVL